MSKACWITISASALAVMAVPGLASAQDVRSDDGAQADQGLQDIVVTAQRRSESAQNVPISVAAFSADSLQSGGTRSTADLTGLVTGLTVSAAGARQPIYLRGVGNNNIAAASAVLLFTDGVYQPFNLGSQSFSDIASVEVAKGPQGTLFGRNATGGVIQVTTRDPSDALSAEFEAGYGNYDTVTGRAYVAGGITENVRASVAAFYENQNDGWGTNFATGSDILTSESYGARGKIVLDVSDATTIKISADYFSNHGNNGSVVARPAGYDFLFDYLTGTKFSPPTIYDVNSNYTPLWRVKEGGASITVDSRIGDLTFASITSWRKNKTYTQVDYDGTPVPFIDISRKDKSTAITQELQLKSPDNARFNWVAGLFYYFNDSDLTPFRFGGIGATPVFGAPPGSPYDIYAFDTVNAYAIYAQGTAELFSDTRLTLGARYTIEKHDQNGFVVAGTVPPGTVGSQSETFRKPSFRASLDHRFNDNVMVYASYNRSFNAGYFNTANVPGFTAAANPVVRPETIDAYEAGFKSELFNRRVRLNVAAFQYDYSNLQQQIFRSGALVTINAASARIRGVDVEMQARVLPSLDLTAAAEFLDPKYISFPEAPLYTFAPNGAMLVSADDASGFSTSNAPHFSFNAGFNYGIASSIGHFDAAMSLNYRGKTYADAFERLPIKSRYLLTASLKWTALDEKTEISVWGKNLLDEAYNESFAILDPVGPAGQPGAPLTYGVTIGRKF